MSHYASIINQTPKRRACLRPLWEAVPIDEVDFEMLEEAAQVGVSWHLRWLVGIYSTNITTSILNP